MLPSYRNQSIDLLCNSIDWFLFEGNTGTNVFTEEINNDLKRISEWAYQWKMTFNPDITKQTQEVIVFRTTVKPFHPQVFFNEVPVERSVFQRNLGIHLDQTLDFSKHINEKISVIRINHS